jgi:REP element-mobilizing transposase RayT
MSRYKIHDQGGLYFTTSTVVGWIDIFSRKNYRDIILNSLKYNIENKALHVFAYIIMSNHIHLVLQAGQPDKWPLSDILRDFKKFTANTILDTIRKEPESRREWLMHMFKYYAIYNTNNRDFQFWQQDNHPIELTSMKVLWQKINYIHLNPVRAGIVDKPEEYIYSSARNYARDNKDCLLIIDLMEPWWV